jgi:hypothetical protein
MSAANAVYLTEAERDERTKFLRGLGLGASKPKPRKPEEPLEPLLRLYQDLTPEQAASPANYEALIYATNRAVQLVFEILGEVIGKESRRVDKRVDASAAKVAALETLVGELRGEISDLTRQVELVRAARGDTDGRQLPASLVQGKGRPAPKPKRAASPPASEARP